MNTFPIRLFHSILSGLFLGAVLSIASLHVLPRVAAQESGGSGTPSGAPTDGPSAPVLNPTPDDLDGDGIPNQWEVANSHNPHDYKDASSDFDFDGLSAKQEYDLSVQTNGQYGKPLGSYLLTTVSHPPGYTAASMILIETAANGLALVEIRGRRTGDTDLLYRNYVFNPADGKWTFVAPPAGVSQTVRLYATDVNSRGQVAAWYYLSGGYKGIVWTPDSANQAGGISHPFLVYPEESAPFPAIPKRISDTGYTLYSVGVPGGALQAAGTDRSPINPTQGAWTTPRYVDVNDYGEFVGTIEDPFLFGLTKTFLAIPNGPVFLSETSSADVGRLTNWFGPPDLDYSSIEWFWDQSFFTEDYYDEYGNFFGAHQFTPGTAEDRLTGDSVELLMSQDDGAVWWRDAIQGSWGSLDLSQVPAAVNDWGEFVGNFTYETGYADLQILEDQFEDFEESEEIENQHLRSIWSYLDPSGSGNGIFLFDGNYHFKSGDAVLGISNDPQVLFRSYNGLYLWSDSVAVPLNKLFTFNSINSVAKLADNGVILIQEGRSLKYIARPSGDADEDGMPDDWEKYYQLDPNDPSDAAVDSDEDGIRNGAEFQLRSDPLQPPGAPPSVDLRPGIDTDGDGLPNVWEWKYGFNCNDASDAVSDTDFDGLSNFEEWVFGSDPNSWDTDWDGLDDSEETLVLGTNVAATDSDQDGIPDGVEVLGGLDPNNANNTEKVHKLPPYLRVQTKDGWSSEGFVTHLDDYWAVKYPLRPEFDSRFASALRASEAWRDDIDATDARPSAKTRLVCDYPGTEEYKMKVLRVTTSTIEGNTVVTGAEMDEFEVQAGATTSNELSTTAINPGTSQYLLPVEVAPEVLAVNSDFDEGRIDPATGYAIPDCDDTDIALEAVRNHLDGKFAINERVTDDMHPGFFGVNPSNLGDDFWAGANVTIRKIDKTDPATGHPESGHVRLYGKWGNGPSEYRAIVPYDFETLAAANLATGGINGTSESVYGAASPFPAGTSYFIEGVHPGKITLEWRYQKGSVDFKHEQTFEVCTHKNALQWKHDLAYKIRLETSNDPSGQINTIAVMLPGETYEERMERASEYYDFYQDCFLTPLRSKPLHTQAITWPGLARLAGSQVVGGLSDSEYARMLLEAGTIPGYVLPQSIQDDLLQWSLSETKDLQQALFTGARTIFQSIGWQMHAYRSSGYRALDWVAAETGEVEVDALVRAGVWKDLRIGILNHDKSLLDGAAMGITDREQNVTIVPTWGVISGLFLGTTNWMFSVLGENSCTPSGIRFRDLFPQFPVPTGSLTNTADRWTWIRPTTTNGILDTWNKLPAATRDTLVRRTLEQDARRFSLISHFPRPLPTPVVALPVWVWDNEDVK